MSTLSIVATPIGNLGDITLRALETLRSSGTIACEDTRVTSKLLSHYEISKPLLVFHAKNARTAGLKILKLLSDGIDVSLVTDAGTPGISDPGSELVSLVTDKLPDVRIETIPGPSAVAAALSIAGIKETEFLFLGFLPHKKGRQTLFEKIADSKYTVVFYESPHRIEKALASLVKVLPDDRRVVVAKELTKIHEAVVAGTAEYVADYFSQHSDKVRGEFVVIVSN